MVLPIDSAGTLCQQSLSKAHREPLKRVARGVLLAIGISLCSATPAGRAMPTPKLDVKTFARFSLNDPIQFKCLDILWTRESNWRHKAHNKAGGAYGIPQIRNKRVAKLSPYQQINWGLRYIEHRYGTPCKALSFWDINYFY